MCPLADASFNCPGYPRWAIDPVRACPFAGWLGNKNMQFVFHEIRRSTAALASHGAILLGYAAAVVHFCNEDFHKVGLRVFAMLAFVVQWIAARGD